MSRIKRIVVATDMSQFASWAEARAAMLALELDSESLDVLHIIDNLALESLRNLALSPLDTEQRLMESARKQMDEIERDLSDKYCVPVTTTALNVGRTHTEIERYASFVDAGLVVLGAHGDGFVRELFVGSTVDKVLRQLTRPLLIVKREPRVPYRQILIPVDFSRYSRLAIEFAMNIAPHANIIVLHAFEVPFEAKLHFAGIGGQHIEGYRAKLQKQKSRQMQELVSDFETTGVSLSHLVEWGSASAVIQEKAKVLEPDLIVIGKLGQSEREGMLLGRVTKQVIQQSDCDVLVVEGAG
ncbi:universal stress protein [Nitrosomonas sp. Nm132]|uniref:universal stress protein n=1 Tax=Nitrosomonas sp. Nm132 TaxID=1881053 RepID=UPI00087F165E|nr:universal stress protein [Nitrosomonas sp. Nm132]SDH82047.1 Nucleotide-binding universal stress protein, UspA family [Nitrosomonas sp. Nm132]